MSGAASKLESSRNSNQESSTAAGSSQQSCPLRQCELSTLTIRCADNRNFILDVANGEPTLNKTRYALQVVARTSDPRIIDIEFDGHCKEGKPATSSLSKKHQQKKRPNTDKLCPTVQIKDGDTDVNQPNPIKLAVYPPVAQTELEGFKGFMKEFFLPPLETIRGEEYAVQSKKCSGSGRLKAVIDTYPVTRWSGNVKFGYSQPEPTGQAQPNDGIENRKPVGTGKWVLSGELDILRDERSWKLNGSSEKDWFPSLRNAIDEMVSTFSHMENFAARNEKKKSKLKVQWPTIELGGKMELQEVKNDYCVDLGGEIHLGFSPLIGATFRHNILPWMLGVIGKIHPAATAFTSFLNYAMEEARKGVRTENASIQVPILLLFIAKGEIKGEVKGQKDAGDKWKTEGSVTAGMTFSLKGVVEVRGHIFTVEFAAGASLSIKGAEGGSNGVGVEGTVKIITENNEPALQGQIDFTGLAIYYSCYKKLGVNDRNTQTRKNEKFSAAADDDDEDESADKTLNTQEEHLFVKLLNKKSWPERKDKTRISNVKY